MNNLGLYLASVLIWGSTWLAITFQLGRVPPEVSVAYRFALASAMLFAWCALRRLRLAYSWREHRWMALQGALLFGLNYVLVYLAEAEISSGLVALIFSLIVFMNIVAARVFFGTKIRRTTLLGASLGVSGVALVMLPEFRHGTGHGRALLGLAFASVSTVSASLGNIVAARNQRHGLPVIQANAFGMAYGALFVALYALGAGRAFSFVASPAYVGSLVYLALFGSVLAFGAYLTLVGRIGADRAGYTGAAIPIVAVALSTVFEGLRWHGATFCGVAFCLAGNVLVLRGKAAAAKPAAGAGAR
ncbi:MAG TPA: EamA family transporter [Opitutaceae bacterium]|nr:EamA family transporter [Opitutaceae bacterium]